MDATYIILTYVHLDDTLKRLNWQDHHHASVSTAEVLTVAVIAAKYFQNHHECALLKFLGRQRAAHVYARFQRLYGDHMGTSEKFSCIRFHGYNSDHPVVRHTQ
jgi:hypothetical protein